MKNKHNKKNDISQFVLLSLGITFVIYLQSYVFPVFPKPFSYIDLTTILIIYIFIQNELITSFLIAIFAGCLLDSLSSIKSGFFIVYFLIALLILNFFSKLFTFDNLTNKFIAFFGIFVLKFLMQYLLIDHSIVSVFNFISKSYGQFLFSCLCFLMITKILDVFGSYLQAQKHSYNPNFKTWR